MHMPKAFAFLCWICLPVICSAQKPFEGRVLYAVSYDSVPEEMKGMEHVLPTEMLWVVRGDDSRMEFRLPMGGTQVVIHRAGIDSAFTLTEVLQQKILVVTRSQLQNTRSKVVEANEKKEIDDHKVKKQWVQSTDGHTLTIWSSTKYKNPSGGETSLIEYLPLDYQVFRNGMLVHMEAKSVTEESVDKTYFEVPGSYERVPKAIYDAWLR